MMRQAIITGVLAAVCAATAIAQDAISLYEVVPSSGNHIPVGSTVEFRLRVQIDTSYAGGLWVYGNGFRLYSPDGAYWDTTYGEYLAPWLPFGDRWISSLGADGVGADTIIFGGEDSAGGFWVVYDEVAWSVTIEVPDDPALYGKTICLDSVADTMTLWPWSTWVWSTLTESYTPTWDGSHCFTIGCCNTDGMRGDANYDRDLNVQDVTFLVNYLFKGGLEPVCSEEGNVNGDNGTNISDLTFLVGYLFRGGPAPPSCEFAYMDAEAAVAAIWLSGELVAPVELYEQIRDQLAIIRTQWGDSISSVGIEFTPPWEPSMLVVGVTDGACDSIAAGEYHHWDSLNEFYDLESITIGLCFPGVSYVKLEFHGYLHPVVLAAAYVGLPGVRYVQPNWIWNDRPMLLLYQNGSQIVYFFRHAWGDCPSGCIYEEYYIFTVADNVAVFHGYYPDYVSVPPEWRWMLDIAWGNYWQ